MLLPETIQENIYDMLQHQFPLEQAAVIMRAINQITQYYDAELKKIIEAQKNHKHQIPRTGGNGQISSITGTVVKEL